MAPQATTAAPQAMKPMPTTAARLTLTDLGVHPEDILTSKEHKLALAQIYGVASGCRTQKDKRDDREFLYFIGNFEGKNLDTGEVIQSSKLYLPDGACQTLEHMLNQIHEKRGASATVNFAFEIYVVKNSEARTGYTYETASLMEPQQGADPLAALRHVVSTKKGDAAKSA